LTLCDDVVTRQRFVPTWSFTHICERGERAEEADAHQAQDEPLSPLHQDVRELVQHGRDHPLQPCELERGEQRATEEEEERSPSDR